MRKNNLFLALFISCFAFSSWCSDSESDSNKRSGGDSSEVSEDPSAELGEEESSESAYVPMQRPRYFVVFADNAKTIDLSRVIHTTKEVMNVMQSNEVAKSYANFSFPEEGKMNWVVQEMKFEEGTAVAFKRHKKQGFRNISGSIYGDNMTLRLPKEAFEKECAYFETFSFPEEFEAPAIFFLLHSNTQLRNVCYGNNRKVWFEHQLSSDFRPFMNCYFKAPKAFKVKKAVITDLSVR